MRSLHPWCVVLTAAMIGFVGCGGERADEKQKAADAPAVTTKVPESDPGRNITESFLTDQAVKRTELDQLIQNFWNNKIGDRKAIRKLILNRKGELLTTKRNIRKSALFTETQKDSLVRPLDEESMNLSRELVAFSE